MLRFDRARSCFLLEGIPIGPGMSSLQLASSFAAPIQPMPHDPAWGFVQINTRPISAFVTFLEGKVHSGYFWAYVPSGGWDDYERAEQQRRAEHERVMDELFGAARFEDQAIHVESMRDPRSGLEQINFEVK
ncbi:hypothetical protein [Sphingomonas mucosissima]|uniref:Uncharacterized protein n=1 Tax=Sphingomonas mucosissima TaxID=370959 RepID=A0A245ZJ94_9SPHN|nr:hypothetical protein [Sphingomonas mucosissima]OWK29804.1 hypothetical protein SPMU_22260 [Sphingomonas mucosissima]